MQRQFRENRKRQVAEDSMERVRRRQEILEREI
jgi:hypothetical protein